MNLVVDSVVEHDEFGNPIMLSASERHQMAEKRYDEKARKFKLSVYVTATHSLCSTVESPVSLVFSFPLVQALSQ